MTIDDRSCSKCGGLLSFMHINYTDRPHEWRFWCPVCDEDGKRLHNGDRKLRNYRVKHLVGILEVQNETGIPGVQISGHENGMRERPSDDQIATIIAAIDTIAARMDQERKDRGH